MLAVEGDFGNMMLSELNALDAPAFAQALGAIYEHSPCVAEAVAAARPFASVQALHKAMSSEVAAASAAQQLALVMGHPDLGGRLARGGELQAASAAEQAGLGLDRLSDAEFEEFEQRNAAYRERFGFPFIVAVKRHTRASMLASFEHRLRHTREEELQVALQEIHAIARFRLDALLDG